MRSSEPKHTSLFEDYAGYCIHTETIQTIVVHYGVDKDTKEKKPRYFNCYMQENCQYRENCPLWEEYRSHLKQQLFRAAHR